MRRLSQASGGGEVVCRGVCAWKTVLVVNYNFKHLFFGQLQEVSKRAVPFVPLERFPVLGAIPGGFELSDGKLSLAEEYALFSPAFQEDRFRYFFLSWRRFEWKTSGLGHGHLPTARPHPADLGRRGWRWLRRALRAARGRGLCEHRDLLHPGDWEDGGVAVAAWSSPTPAGFFFFNGWGGGGVV